MVQGMAAAGWSDAGMRLPGWLRTAGFGEIDEGGRTFWQGEDIVSQADYAADVIESALDALDRLTRSHALRAGLRDLLRALPGIPGAGSAGRCTSRRGSASVESRARQRSSDLDAGSTGQSCDRAMPAAFSGGPSSGKSRSARQGALTRRWPMVMRSALVLAAFALALAGRCGSIGDLDGELRDRSEGDGEGLLLRPLSQDGSSRPHRVLDKERGEDVPRLRDRWPYLEDGPAGQVDHDRRHAQARPLSVQVHGRQPLTSA